MLRSIACGVGCLETCFVGGGARAALATLVGGTNLDGREFHAPSERDECRRRHLEHPHSRNQTQCSSSAALPKHHCYPQRNNWRGYHSHRPFDHRHIACRFFSDTPTDPPDDEGRGDASDPPAGEGEERDVSDSHGGDDVEGDEEDEGRSVLHQLDEDGNLRGDPLEGEEGDPETQSTSAGDGEEEEDVDPESEEGSEEDKTEAELRAMDGEERYEAMFNQWYRSPTKNRHLLRELISPRVLDDLERWTYDPNDDINEKDFHDYLVDIRASQKAVKSGRIVRYRAMVVVGNLKGLCSYGTSKAATVQAAIENAKKRALKTLIFIPRYREHTIFEQSSAKCTATKVLMWPRSRGFGVRCNDVLYQVCELIGLQDISIKVIGSRSKFNTIRAFFDALEKTRSALEMAEEKGVYLRERCLFAPPASMKNYV
ncbi:hypothetical protein BSKO_02298 [Bryopsis sp. KO-2023]|nr:hypothetical protein BSKO_02298 [Bryopsis sp. KO-2023]